VNSAFRQALTRSSPDAESPAGGPRRPKSDAIGCRQCCNGEVNHAAVLRDFDQQMRRQPADVIGTRVEQEDRVTRVVSTGGGWNGIVWSDMTAADADAIIGAQIRRFAPVPETWEWKYYSYDQPADLPERLLAAGFVPEEPEALMVAEISSLALDAPPPAGVELVPVRTEADITAVVRVHDQVFGGYHAAIGDTIREGLQSEPRSVEAVLAVADGAPVSAARVEFPDGRDFASLWGGGTLPEWRKRGIFRSLVAYRARLASERGYHYLQVDALPDSRPILGRLGFAELAMTTPYEFHGSG
jgi:ribosomal protein S18 acetylase RimI-like enzyme